MGEVIHLREAIHLREKLRERAIAKSRASDHQSLERAVEILKQNLHATTQEIIDAPAFEQAELLDRAEHFVALIRYGLRMLGDDGDSTAQPSVGSK